MLHPTRRLYTAAALAATLCFAPAAPAQTTASEQILTRTTFRDVARKVSPAVVNVNVKSGIVFGQGGRGRVNIPPSFPLDDNMRGMLEQLLERESPNLTPSEREDYRYSRTGSGVIISPDGYVVTSNHIVENIKAEDIEISLPDGRTFEKVALIGTDELTDLAVLKIQEGSSLPHLEWGNSDDVEPGDHVLAVGNPLEFNNSVSQGIISAKHRTINKAAIEDLIQTTAMINPGNSGGALVDLDGKLIGINMAIATSTGLWSGLGFAIPSKTARDVSEQLINKGKVGRGYLGIEMQDLTAGLANQLGYTQNFGIVVGGVKADSAAEKAGLQRYDIIAKVNGTEIKDIYAMHRQVGVRRPGETVEMEVHRENDVTGKLEQKQVRVTLAERPTMSELRNQQRNGVRPDAPGAVPNRTDTTLGLQVEPNTGGKGVVVRTVEPGSRAALAGFRAGDILYEVNKKAVASQQDLQQALRDQASNSHLIYYEREGTTGMQTVPAR